MKHDETKIETLAYHESIVSSREIDKEDVLAIDSAIWVAKQYAEHMVQQTRQEVEEKIDGRIEYWADLEHRRWSKWQQYMHSKLEYVEYEKDGKTFAGYLLDADDYEHWERQIDTDYTELSEREKDSDRAQVKPYIDDMKQLLSVIKQEEV